jgi:hypothetical protein
VAALLDWEEFRVENSKKRPEFLEWMSTVREHTPSLPAAAANDPSSETKWTTVDAYDRVRVPARESGQLVTV